MTLPISTTPYCSVADLEAMEMEDNPVGKLDALIQDASRIIDAYCWQTFDPADEKTVTVSDVRGLLVSLPGPFTDITAVVANGIGVTDTGYIVEDWGIRLYGIEPIGSGWPSRAGVDAGTWPNQASGAPYGAQVSVTATFGYDDVPVLVQRACRELCAELYDGRDPHGPGETVYQVDAYSVHFNPNDPHPLDTTGNVDVDAMLTTAGLRRSKVLVA